MFKNFQSKAAYKIINLQNLGFNATEQKLMVLAGTDKSGTSMYGLAQAAQSKGLSAAGMELSIDELKPNHIVHVLIDGTAYFSVVREITETSVKLADPKFGNIEMTRERFSEIFTGHALVISNPNNLTQVNGTDQTNNQLNQSTENTNLSESVNNSTDTNSTSAQVDNSTTLTSEQMQNITGMHWRGKIGTWVARRSVRFAIRHRRAIKAFGRDEITGGISVGAGGAAAGFGVGKLFALPTKGISIPVATAKGQWVVLLLVQQRQEYVTS